LTNAFGIIEQRKLINVKRQVEGEKFLAQINGTRTKARKIVSTKPWTEEYFQKNFSHKVRTLSKWYTEATLQQSKLALYDVSLI